VVSDAMVAKPTEMIMLGDARAFADPNLVGTWPANIGPYDVQPMASTGTTGDPSLFCDGHAESVLRRDLIDPNRITSGAVVE